MAEIRIEGPVGADPSLDAGTAHQPPKFTYGALLKTRDVTNPGKHRIYRYCRIHGALTLGTSYFVSSVNAVLAEAVTGINFESATNRPEIVNGSRVCIPQWSTSSPTAEAGLWVQTGGYFDSTGAVCVSATVNQAMYLSPTNGKLTTMPTFLPAILRGAKALSNGATVNVYCPDELVVMRDMLA